MRVFAPARPAQLAARTSAAMAARLAPQTTTAVSGSMAYVLPCSLHAAVRPCCWRSLALAGTAPQRRCSPRSAALQSLGRKVTLDVTKACTTPDNYHFHPRPTQGGNARHIDAIQAVRELKL